jgi:cytochrome c peroxidase
MELYRVDFVIFKKTHHGHTLSHGIDNLVGDRNTPSIQNQFSDHFYVTMEYRSSRSIAIIPLTNPVEMNADLSAVW